ncbi:MAG: acyltransferase family protein [Rhodoferax sp.]|nr:acyltransferase family protein [Rhodoferax sp.]
MRLPNRIDAIKVLASQLIVWHHLASYGPLSDALHQIAPALGAWLYDYARMAVQAFLVVGGYLAAHSLNALAHHPHSSLAPVLLRRYLRLVLPLGAALLIAMVCSAVARPLLGTDFVPASPTLAQVASHLLLLQGVLGFDALSAGVWYVAIDFQLYVLLALSVAGCGRWARAAVVVGTVASLFYFNLRPEWDHLGVYFFGAYGLGAMAYWAGHASERNARHLGLGLVITLGVLALAFAFRERIAIALAIALILATRLPAAADPSRTRASLAAMVPIGPAKQPFFKRLATSSYALFLLHFPVLMLGNAVFSQWPEASAPLALAMLLACWLLSMWLAIPFERWIERPLQTLVSRRFRPAPLPAQQPEVSQISPK